MRGAEQICLVIVKEQKDWEYLNNTLDDRSFNAPPRNQNSDYNCLIAIIAGQYYIIFLYTYTLKRYPQI